MKYLITLVMGFLIGQQYMIRAYDPKHLEENALGFSAFAYYTGCLDDMLFHHTEGQTKEFCINKAQQFSKNNKEIFHSKAWKY